jgi:hypothetical protein
LTILSELEWSEEERIEESDLESEDEDESEEEVVETMVLKDAAEEGRGGRTVWISLTTLVSETTTGGIDSSE